MEKKRNTVIPFPNQEDKGYTYHGEGAESSETSSIFTRAEHVQLGGPVEQFSDMEMPTEKELSDDVLAHLDTVDFQLQQDRVFSAHELQQMEHVLMDAKRKLEGMRRNPMVTKQLTDSIDIKYNMLRDLLNEHYIGNESDTVDSAPVVLQARSQSMKQAA